MLSACMPVKTSVTNQYKLEAFSHQRTASAPLHRSLLISQPEAMAGYQTEQMLYVKKPYELSSFAENAWIAPPANMLYPLLIEAFQADHRFSAIASSPYADKVDYRLDTQLLAMQQTFLTKPSEFILTLKIVVTRVKSNQVLASRIITEHVACPTDTPYGGVIAANKAAIAMTEKIKRVVMKYVQQDIKATAS